MASLENESTDKTFLKLSLLMPLRGAKRHYEECLHSGVSIAEAILKCLIQCLYMHTKRHFWRMSLC
jgi:hypothetical protein